MTAAVKASKLFVPPYPPRSDKPRGALSMILTLRRNPLEIWGKADFERPISTAICARTLSSRTSC